MAWARRSSACVRVFTAFTKVTKGRQRTMNVQVFRPIQTAVTGNNIQGDSYI